MKNITAIERIAMQKTAIQKITAKITTTAAVFFWHYSTTNLKAQAVQQSKSGFFAGFVFG